MSLINQMLKDIDKRQGNASGMPSATGIPLAVTRGRSGSSSRGWLLGMALLVALVAGVYWFRQAAQPAPAPALSATTPVAVPPASSTVSVPVVAAVQETSVASASAPAPAEISVVTKSSVARADKQDKGEKAAIARASVPEPGQALATRESAKTGKVSSTESMVDTEKSPKKSSSAVAVAAPEGAIKTEKRAEMSTVGQVTRVLSSEQRADNAYREATAQLRQGRPLEAQKLLQQALTDQPAHLEARLVYAQLLQGDGRVSEARALLTEGMALKPQAFALNAALAQMLLMSRDADQAVATLERGLSAAGETPSYHALLATALQQQSRHADAVQHYATALRQQPDSSNWLVGLGISLQALGNMQGAAEAYQRAIDLGLPASLSQFARDSLRQVTR